MKILGIDPGTTKTGFGSIIVKQSKLKLLDFGVIETKPKIPEEEKLTEIFFDIKKIIKSQKPDLVAIEDIFFFKNAKTAIAVGQAKGVILLASNILKVKIIVISPLQIKMAVANNGRASKEQIQEMIKTLLNLSQIPSPDHAADALACAVCAASLKGIYL